MKKAVEISQLEKPSAECVVRLMCRTDYSAVLVTENKSFDEPLSMGSLIPVLHNPKCMGIVAEMVGTHEIVGHLMYFMHPQQIEFRRFAVSPMYRRCGIGKQMVNAIVSRLEMQRRSAISMEIDGRNVPGQLLLQSCGFRATAFLKGDDGTADSESYVMCYALPEKQAKDIRGKRVSQYFELE